MWGIAIIGSNGKFFLDPQLFWGLFESLVYHGLDVA